MDYGSQSIWALIIIEILVGLSSFLGKLYNHLRLGLPHFYHLQYLFSIRFQTVPAKDQCIPIVTDMISCHSKLHRNLDILENKPNIHFLHETVSFYIPTFEKNTPR